MCNSILVQIGPGRGVTGRKGSICILMLSRSEARGLVFQRKLLMLPVMTLSNIDIWSVAP